MSFIGDKLGIPKLRIIFRIEAVFREPLNTHFIVILEIALYWRSVFMISLFQGEAEGFWLGGFLVN